SLERRLRQRFVDDDLGSRLREVRVAKLGDIREPLVSYMLLGHVARTFFTDEVAPGNSIGLCGGFAVSRMVHALQRGEVPGGVRVFPIAVTPVFEKATVSANANVSALAYRHF